MQTTTRSDEQARHREQLPGQLADADAALHRHAAQRNVGLILAHAARLHQHAFGALDELAFRQFRADAFRVALLVLNEMQAFDISPNHVAYRTALSVFLPRNNGDARMEQESKQVTDVIFNRCCQDGQVHPEIVGLLHLYRPEMYNRLPKDFATGKVQLPPEWTINVHERN